MGKIPRWAKLGAKLFCMHTASRKEAPPSNIATITSAIVFPVSEIKAATLSSTCAAAQPSPVWSRSIYIEHGQLAVARVNGDQGRVIGG